MCGYRLGPPPSNAPNTQSHLGPHQVACLDVSVAARAIPKIGAKDAKLHQTLSCHNGTIPHHGHRLQLGVDALGVQNVWERCASRGCEVTAGHRTWSHTIPATCNSPPSRCTQTAPQASWHQSWFSRLPPHQVLAPRRRRRGASKLYKAYTCKKGLTFAIVVVAATFALWLEHILLGRCTSTLHIIFLQQFRAHTHIGRETPLKSW